MSHNFSENDLIDEDDTYNYTDEEALEEEDDNPEDNDDRYCD